MRRIRNKAFYFLILSFVFLFLAGRMHFGLDKKITVEEAAGINSSQAKLVHSSTILKEEVKTEKLSEQDLIATDSVAITRPVAVTHPGSEAEPPLSRGELNEEYYKVAKVVDGDTIDIIMNGQTERLRLIGINTPETVDPRKPVECFGREASDNAKKLLSGQEVRVEADASQEDRDKYGRLLRYVWRRDGLFYNLEAIKDGFAYEYTYQIPYQYQEDFKAAQKNAEENKLGLWADGACGEKNINSTNVSSSTKSSCVIKGNIGADNIKIYHLPECSYYKQTVVDESKGEKWFCSEAEAIAAGWRKAKNCP